MSGIGDALKRKIDQVKAVIQMVDAIAGMNCGVEGCNRVEDGVCLCEEAAKQGDWKTAAEMKALCGNEKVRGMMDRHGKEG